MRIIKKPKFKKITCPVCGCVFLPSDKDILADADHEWKPGKLFSRCPVCLVACQTEPRKKPIVGVYAEIEEGHDGMV